MSDSSHFREAIFTAIALFLFGVVLLFAAQSRGGEYVEALVYLQEGKFHHWAYPRGECGSYVLEVCANPEEAERELTPRQPCEGMDCPEPDKRQCERLTVQTYVQFWRPWTCPVARCVDPYDKLKPSKWVPAVRESPSVPITSAAGCLPGCATRLHSSSEGP